MVRPFFLLVLILILITSNVTSQNLISGGSVSEYVLSVSDGAQTQELPVKIIKGIADGPVLRLLPGFMAM